MGGILTLFEVSNAAEALTDVLAQVSVTQELSRNKLSAEPLNPMEL